MKFRERKKIFKELEEKYTNIEWKPINTLIMVPGYIVYRIRMGLKDKKLLMRINKPKYEENFPTDGVIIFPQNHCNSYDSIVTDYALRGTYYTCLASDEPRKTKEGTGFKAKGVVWLNREDNESKMKASEAEIALMKKGCDFSYCPEGLWGVIPDNSSHKLLLHISYGVARAAIEVSKKTKVYIVPLIVNYNYKGDTGIIKDVDINFGKSIEVDKNMSVEELTEIIEDAMWTGRWKQLEQNAQNSKESVHYECLYGSDRVFKRDDQSKEKWDALVSNLLDQYKLINWKQEKKYEIKSKAQKEQEEVMRTLDLIDFKQGLEKFEKSVLQDEVRREHLVRVRKR